MPRTLIACTLLVATITLASCQVAEEASSSDLILRNGGSADIERITVNGVGQGPLPAGGVMNIEDVGQGTFFLQAFRAAGDATPCATFETTTRSKGQAVHHSFDCTLP